MNDCVAGAGETGTDYNLTQDDFDQLNTDIQSRITGDKSYLIYCEISVVGATTTYVGCILFKITNSTSSGETGEAGSLEVETTENPPNNCSEFWQQSEMSTPQQRRGLCIDALAFADRSGETIVIQEDASVSLEGIDDSMDRAVKCCVAPTEVDLVAPPPAQEVVPGCTDSEATNYLEEATVDDGSCVYPEARPPVILMPVETDLS